MDVMFQDVIEEVERYAHLAPSLRLSAEIIREAEERRQVYLRNTGSLAYKRPVVYGLKSVFSEFKKVIRIDKPVTDG
jgi:hypothetical protein